MKQIAKEDLQLGRQIGNTETFTVHLTNSMRMMEVGYRQARHLAMVFFDIGECGNSGKLEEWTRSDSCFYVENLRTIIQGNGEVTMTFRAWAEKCLEDEDDD